ncbi:MAG: hypothetical protein H6618_01995 [Deltaproteobacteria bacterium]|nr:hypothetical protein [Deltaproteobacteria bacterium]
MSRTDDKTGTFRITATEDGLHIKDSILWLDSQRSGSLSFLSEVPEASKFAKQQIIATEETAKLLEIMRKKIKPLICQYNRPFSVGRLRMELLPSGHSLGGASLYVESGSSSALYAPAVQIQKVPVHRGMQLKRADTLILRASQPEPGQSPVNRSREKDRLLRKIHEHISADQWPLIFCRSIATAQELTQFLCKHSIPLSAHPHIYQINKIYQSYGCDLGSYASYSAKRTRKKVVLCPLLSYRHGASLPEATRPVLIIRHRGTELPEYLQNLKSADQFELIGSSFGQDYVEIIDKVQPKEVLFFGDYARVYAEAYQHKSSTITFRALYPNAQPPLF